MPNATWTTAALLFAALPLAAQPEPIQDLVEIGSGSEVILRWTVPNETPSESYATPPWMYEVRYSPTGPLTDDTWNMGYYVPFAPQPYRDGAPAPGEYETMTLYDLVLTPGFTYYVGIRCFNIPLLNWTGVSNVVAVSHDTVAPGGISDLEVVSSASGKVTLRWTATGDDGATGQASAYDLRYLFDPALPVEADDWLNSLQAWSLPAPAVAGTVQTVEILTGVPTGPLHFSIQAVDDRHNAGPRSNVVLAILPGKESGGGGGGGDGGDEGGGCGGSATGAACLAVLALVNTLARTRGSGR